MNHVAGFLAQSDTSVSPAAAGAGIGSLLCFGVVYLVLLVAIFAGWWKIFVKAGKPGWAAIVPIYNVIILLEIVGKPILWIVWLLIPCVNFVFGIMLMIEVAKRFQKDVGFAIGMILLPMVFLPMLGFGDAQYTPPPAM